MFRPEEYAVSLRRLCPSPLQQIAGLDESKVTLQQNILLMDDILHHQG